MKEQLNPIPRDLSLDAKQVAENPPGGEEASSRGLRLSRRRFNARVSRIDAAYHWLLITSLVLSSILCWLYVTKPVIVQDKSASDKPMNDNMSAMSGGPQGGRVAALVPADESLPGRELSQAPDEGPLNSGGLQKISPVALTESGVENKDSALSLGWESTNYKVQHILSVDAGGDELEKIVLNVPALYQTRTMRWSAEDVVKARNVMQRLMVYESNLNNLRTEGEGILRDWNELIEKTSPTAALRADSPSLPCNHGQGESPGDLPESSSVIKVNR